MDVDAPAVDAEARSHVQTLTVQGAGGPTQIRIESPTHPASHLVVGQGNGPSSLEGPKQEAAKQVCAASTWPASLWPPSWRVLTPLSYVLQPLNSKEREVLVQCIALKMLTDFTLMYTSCIGVISRRDAEVATRGASPTARGVRPDGDKPAGALFR